MSQSTAHNLETIEHPPARHAETALPITDVQAVSPTPPAPLVVAPSDTGATPTTPGHRRASRANRLITSASLKSLASRLALAWLPTYAILLWFAGLDGATTAVTSVVLAAIFAPTSRWVLQRARAQPLAYGPTTATLASAFLGYVLAAAVVFTIPNLGPSQAVLAASSLVAAILATMWYTHVVGPFQAAQRVIIVGGGDDVARLVSDAEHRSEQFSIVAILADDPSPRVRAHPLLRGKTSDLGGMIQELAPDLVVIAVQRGRPEIFRQLLDVASSDFSMLGLPEFYELAFGRLPLGELTPAWFMSTLHVYNRPYNRFSKRAFDVSLAFAGLIVMLLLIPFVALVVKRTKGPLLYRQTRLGEHGELFTILKFRTMYSDAEVGDGAVWAATGDSRIIPGGGLLRRSRIDELPQLWNVLKGEMSIVGPRPERPEFIEALEAAVPFWQQRALLRPGITGWAQIREGYTADEMGAARKLSYDLWYLRHRSLTLDAVICSRTIGTLVSGSGAR